MVERRHHRQPTARGFVFRARLAVEHGRAREQHFGPKPLRTVDLHARRRLGHDDDGTNAEQACGERHRLAVVARGVGDHARRQLLVGELLHEVQRAARLEGAGALQVLALVADLVAEPLAGVSADGGVDVFWRYSRSDAVYAPPGFVTLRADEGASAYVGTAVDVNLEWRLDRHVTVQASYVNRESHRSLIGEDMATPTNLVDPKSGMTYYQAVNALAAKSDSNSPIRN